MNSFDLMYNESKDIFQKHLDQYIETLDFERPLLDSIVYSLNSYGKRLRPVLMIETAKMIGIDIDKIIPLAISLEMIHTYSLIHDDLPAMDNDVLRRGIKTNHVVFGEANAILAGDALLNLAMENALSIVDDKEYLNYIEAVKYLFKCSGANGMIGGQCLDIKKTGIFQTRDELSYMHSMKTGALFMASCVCPALVLGFDNATMTAIEDFSKYFGLLFQITDDILDVVGEETVLGKSTGKDEHDQKSTYVTMLGLEKAQIIAISSGEMAKESLKVFGEKGYFHRELINYVLKRKK